MSSYEQELDAIRASDAFQRRLIRRMTEEARAEAAESAPRTLRLGRPARRLAVLLAAALALLLAGTALAVYWSSAQKAKERAAENAEKSRGELEQEAALLWETAAPTEIEDGALIPIEGTAEADGVTLTLRYFEQRAEFGRYRVSLHFSAESDTLGILLSGDPVWWNIPDRAVAESGRPLVFLGTDGLDFTLTADGRDCPVYVKTDEPETVAVWKGETGHYVVSFLSDERLAVDTSLKWSGTLLRRDASGAAAGTEDAFAIPFAVTAEAVAAYRAQRVNAGADALGAAYAARADALEGLPDEASAVELAGAELTLVDLARTEEGVLLGIRHDVTTEGVFAQKQQVYIDGYRCASRVTDYVWEKARVRSRRPESDPDAVYEETEVLELLSAALPCGADRLPAVSLIGFSRRQYADARPMEAVDFVFRYEWATGRVTLPASDAQRENWLAEQAARAADGRNETRSYAVTGQKQEIGGTTLEITEVRFLGDGRLRVYYRIERMNCSIMAWETEPAFEVAGHACTKPGQSLYAGASQPFRVDVREFLDNFKLEKNRSLGDDWLTYADVRPSELPASFTVKLTYDLYDLDAQGERTLTGTFRFELPIARDSYAIVALEERDLDF